MAGEDFDRDEVVFIGPDGQPVTAADMAEDHLKRQMANQAFGADFRRLIFEELDDDQLGCVQHLFRMLGDHSVEAHALLATVNWYEGLIDGAYHARKLARGLSLTPTRECHPYTPDQEDPETYWACFAEFDGVVCGKDRDGDAHVRWGEGGGLE